MAIDERGFMRKNLARFCSFLRLFLRTSRRVEDVSPDEKPRNVKIYPQRCEECDLSDDRTFLAWQRNHMANERTFLAWCRTGISLIVFSFVIERFDIMIREMRLFSPNPELFNNVHSARYLGPVTFVLGSLIILLAGWRFLYIRKHINRGDTEFSTLPDIFLMISVLATVITTFIFFVFFFQ